MQRAGHLTDHTVEWYIPDGFDKHVVPLDKWPNEFGVTIKMWRAGQKSPWVGEYTVGRARRAGLWNNSFKKPWLTDPERMLFNRARAFPIRDGFSDDIFGLAMAEEALDHTPPPKARIVDNSALDDDLPAPPADDV